MAKNKTAVRSFIADSVAHKCFIQKSHRFQAVVQGGEGRTEVAQEGILWQALPNMQ